MTFPRQRPDGCHETECLVVPNHSNSRRTNVLPSRLVLAIPVPSLSLPVLGSSLLIASCLLLGTNSIAQARSSSTQHKAKELPGTWAWTTGSQTYLRVRPSALTPAVAKVPKRTKLFVWGKFDGWYRVETPDHKFGWIFNDYLNCPKAEKIKELSHQKAKIASDRAANQTMYGSAAQLKNYHARYGAKGAERGLKKLGISLAKAAPKPAPAKPKMAAAPKPVKVVAKTPIAKTPIAKAPASTLKAPVKLAVKAPAVKAPAVKPVVLASHAPASQKFFSKTRASATPDTSYSPRDNSAAAPPMRTETPVAVAPLAPVEPRAERIVATPPLAKPAAPQTVAAKPKTVAAKPAPKPAPKPKVAAAKKPPVKMSASQRRRAEHERRAAKNRENLRKRLASRAANGRPVMKVPALPAAQLRPLTPAELLKAREAYLASQKKARPASTTSDSATQTEAASQPNESSNTAQIHSSGFAPTAAPPAATQPATWTLAEDIRAMVGDGVFNQSDDDTTGNPLLVRVAQTGKSKSAPNRGGSPRDYAKGSNKLGQGMANQALGYRGMPYIRGAESPNRGFDCSGLIYFLLRQRGYNPPRTAAGFASYGKAVPRNQLQPGDIVLFANTYHRGVSHCGIYMGNNKFVHAANPRKGVRVDSLSTKYYAKKYYGARRVPVKGKK